MREFRPPSSPSDDGPDVVDHTSSTTPFGPDDAGLLVELDFGPKGMRCLTGGKPAPPHPGRWRAIRRVGPMGPEDRATGTFVGRPGLRPRDGDTGSLVAAAFTRCPARCVYTETTAVNKVSRRVMEEAGLQHIRHVSRPVRRPDPGCRKR